MNTDIGLNDRLYWALRWVGEGRLSREDFDQMADEGQFDSEGAPHDAHF